MWDAELSNWCTVLQQMKNGYTVPSWNWLVVLFIPVEEKEYLEITSNFIASCFCFHNYQMNYSAYCPMGDTFNVSHFKMKQILMCMSRIFKIYVVRYTIVASCCCTTLPLYAKFILGLIFPSSIQPSFSSHLLLPFSFTLSYFCALFYSGQFGNKPVSAYARNRQG